MKIFRAVLLLGISSIFFISCSLNSPNESSKNSFGKFSLAFDKTTIPENVSLVRATLTKQNYDPIIASLNLLDSNSAEIFINEIPVGQWHLLVEAINEQEVLLYSGETDITIIAGEIITVNLTLQPTGNDSGSLYLFVNWGENNWFDHPVNPIIPNDDNSYAPYGYSSTFVIFDDGIYKMWYTSMANSAVTYVFYATSPNGITWTPYQNNPVIYPGSYGNWDAGRVSAGPVIKVGNTYRMYFNAFRDQNENWHVGLATSSDGISWEKKPTPILSGEGWHNRIAATDVTMIDSIYHLYFSGWIQPYYYSIGLATSSDGILWEKYSPQPILEKTEIWEDDGVLSASIVKENEIYKMVYQGAAPVNTSFGFAYSTDGISWVKDQLNPFFGTEDITTNAIKIVFPNFIKTENEYRIYYNGYTQNNNFICLARKFIY
jgi:predicted GH43/DUF377 family glycosyl hydrolase